MAVACDRHLERSVASCKASVGVRQQSLVTWRSQVLGGRPGGLFHPVTFWEPSWTSQARFRMALAVTVSGIRAIWPNSRRRRRQTTDSRDSWPEASRTSTLRMKSDHLMPSIRRWQRMWNASSLRHPTDVSVHVSQPYSNTDSIQQLKIRNFVELLICQSRQSLSRRFIADDAIPILWRTSSEEFSLAVNVDPRYRNRNWSLRWQPHCWCALAMLVHRSQNSEPLFWPRRYAVQVSQLPPPPLTELHTTCLQFIVVSQNCYVIGINSNGWINNMFTGTPSPLKLRPYDAIEIRLLLLLSSVSIPEEDFKNWWK